MPTLRQARNIGAIGSVLFLVGAAANLVVLSGAGLILLLVAVKYVASSTRDRELYGHMQAAVVFLIVGIIIGGLIVFAGVRSVLASLQSGANASTTFSNLVEIVNLGLVFVWIFSLIASFFLKKSYDSLASDLNVSLFSTVGKLFLIGAALIIVFGVGLIIILVAAALQVAAFLSVPDELPSQPHHRPFGQAAVSP